MNDQVQGNLRKPGVFGVIFALALMPMLLCAQEGKEAPAETPGMTALFNGKDLTGWDGDSRFWSVKEGVIHGETTPEKPARGNTFLICTACETRDFELRLSFRCTASNNSGIQYRSSRIVDKPGGTKRWRLRGYQHEIRNEKKLPNVSGFIYDESGSRGRICLVGEQAVWGREGKKRVVSTLISQEEYEQLFKLDDWNDVVIVAQGNQIRHYLNGRLILDFTDEDAQRALLNGVMGLQLHGGKPMWTEFKNIRIKALKSE